VNTLTNGPITSTNPRVLVITRDGTWASTLAEIGHQIGHAIDDFTRIVRAALPPLDVDLTEAIEELVAELKVPPKKRARYWPPAPPRLVPVLASQTHGPTLRDRRRIGREPTRCGRSAGSWRRRARR
jgi:hypothetical protein